MKALKAATAGLLAMFIMAAPPYLLIRYIGNPWPPEGVSLAAPLTDNAILGLIAVVVWILWAQLALSLLVEAYAAITDASLDVRLPVFGFQQDLARALVGAILTTAAMAPLIAGSVANPAAANPPASPQAASSTTHIQQPTPVKAPTAATNHHQHQQQQETKNVQVHVARGDTLWSMAEKYFGDGDRWSEIAEANQGQTMVDGRIFASADQIRAGWVLNVPGVSEEHRNESNSSDYQVKPGDSLSSIAKDQLGDPNAYPAIFAASQGINQPGGKTLTDPGHIEPEWTLSIPTGDHEAGKHREQRPAGRSIQLDDSGDDTEDDAPEEATEQRTAEVEPNEIDEVQSSTSDASSDFQADDDSWPVMTMGGVGAVLAGLLIGLLARRRAAQRRRRKPGERLPLPDGPAERVETEVRAVSDEIGVEFVDQALRSLAACTVATQNPLPQLQTARMTPEQLDLYFSAPPDQPLPAPWQATSDPAVWVLPVSERHLLDAADTELPALWPALVSVGHDAESGVILLNLAQLQGLTVTGDHHLTSQVMLALAIELGTAPWAVDMDLTVIGSLVELTDVLDHGRMRYVPTAHNVRFEPGRVHVIIAMSPLSSDQEQDLLNRGASVVIQTPTVEGQLHSGWTIDLVDAEHATVQPIGLQINPQRVDSTTYAAILEMLTSSLADPIRPGQDQVVPFARERTSTAQAATPRQPDGTPGSNAADMTVSRIPLQHPTGVGGTSRGLPGLGHHMISGNTITAPRTSPEQSLMLVEPMTDRTQEAETSPNVVPVELEQEILDARDVPLVSLTQEEPEAGDHEATHREVELGAVEYVTARHPMIRLLGPTVEIVGTTTQAPNSESHLRVCTRIATYLALNPDTSRTALIEAIWSGRRVSPSTVDSRISQLRNWLGENPDDEKSYLPRRSLRFTDAVSTDWGQFVDLVGDDPTQASTDVLEEAVRLIRGRPLEGEESKHYGFAEYFAQDVIDVLADATYELARRRYMAGEWHSAGSAAGLGTRVDPSNERLWRLRIHAAHSARDAAGVNEAIDRMHARITELGFQFDPETNALLSAISGHDDSALHQARQLI